MHEEILVAAKRIKALEVQGARNVAIAAINSVREAATQSKVKNKEEFVKELSEAKELLFASIH